MKRLFFLIVSMTMLFSCEYQDNGVTSINEVISSHYLINGIVAGNLDTYIQNNQIVRLTGKPGITTVTIGNADLSKYEPCFVLYVATGNTPETTVSSAIIKLDGMEVLNTSDFNNDGASYTFEVCNLTQTSALTVEVRGAPGSFVNVWIEGKLKIPTEGLVAYYPFNSNVSDESGNEYHGTNNGATLTYDRFGRESSAYFFDGQSNIVINNTENLNFSSGSFTLATWLNFNSFMQDVCPLAKHIWAVGGWALNIFEDKLTFYLDFIPRLTSDDIYSDGNWHFLVGVFDGTTQYLYIDGILIKTQTGALGYSNSTPITIGSTTGGGFFTGSLDDIRIYNRALSEQEVTSLLTEN